MADPQFLLDTNILVYLVGGKSDRLRGRVESCAPGSLITSSLCVAEALFGLADPAAEAAFGRILTVVQPLPFDLAAASRLPDVPFRGGQVDRFIAAQALSLNLPIVTNNETDFADVPGLRTQNWLKP